MKMTNDSHKKRQVYYLVKAYLHLRFYVIKLDYLLVPIFYEFVVILHDFREAFSFSLIIFVPALLNILNLPSVAYKRAFRSRTI